MAELLTPMPLSPFTKTVGVVAIDANEIAVENIDAFPIPEDGEVGSALLCSVVDFASNNPSDFETVTYTGRDLVDSKLTGVERAVEGAARQWPANTPIACCMVAEHFKRLNAEVTSNRASLLEHDVDVTAEEGRHGLRVIDDKLEYFDGEDWQQISGGSSKIPVGNVSDFSAEAGDGKVTLTWKDPEDVVAGEVTVAYWKGTKILRKTGSFPQNENDGVLVVDSGVRDQYETEGFEDTNLENGTEYFYMAFPYTTENVFTVDVVNRVSATPSSVKIYGVRVDKTETNPNTRVTYIGGSIGFTPIRGNNGVLQWGSWENICDELGIAPCVLKNKQVQYYLDPDDYAEKAEGGAAVITGADGDVMVELGKTLWTKWTDEGDTYTIEFSSAEFDGAVKYAFEIEDGYNLVPYYPLLLIQQILVVLFKSTDAQGALGRGHVNDSSAYSATGVTNNKGMFYGNDSDKKEDKVKALGIEDFWGNKFWWIDGLVTNSNYDILIGKSNFNDAGSGYTSYSSGISVNTSGCISKVQGGNEKGFIIKEAGGAENQYYCDYGNLNSARVARFGGYYSLGSAAGFAFLFLYHDSSDATATIGARLFCAANGKVYIGAYLGTIVGGKLRSISGTAEPTGKQKISEFRTAAQANNS